MCLIEMYLYNHYWTNRLFYSSLNLIFLTLQHDTRQFLRNTKIIVKECYLNVVSAGKECTTVLIPIVQHTKLNTHNTSSVSFHRSHLWRRVSSTLSISMAEAAVRGQRPGVTRLRIIASPHSLLLKRLLELCDLIMMWFLLFFFLPSSLETDMSDRHG